MGLINKIKRRVKNLMSNGQMDNKLLFQKTYAQCGEDIIIDFIFSQYLKIEKPTYLDIGAYHPFKFSNTALLYERGSTGVCIEPDPFLFQEIKKYRTRDNCLNIGISLGEDSTASFYVMSARTLNTFSKEDAERYASYGNQKIEEVVSVSIKRINQVVEANFNSFPDFVSLDVEGLDLAILNDFDFNRFKPHVWCIETLTYVEDNTERKITEIIDFMKSKNYFVYSDTYINTIFVHNDSWKNRT